MMPGYALEHELADHGGRKLAEYHESDQGEVRNAEDLVKKGGGESGEKTEHREAEVQFLSIDAPRMSVWARSVP